MIKIQVIGHLGKDALVKEVNGKKVIEFSVAHSESYRNAEGVKIESTTWVNCSYWSERTAVAQYLTKGTMVFVEGKPVADAYLNNHGKPAAALRMQVANIQLLGSTAARPQQTPSPAKETLQQGNSSFAAGSFNAADNAPDLQDDLPF